MAKNLQQDITDFDDILGVEDVDVHDETSLRWLEGEIKEVLNGPNPVTPVRARVSILNSEQWKSVVRRFLGARYRGAAPHLHVLRDPKTPNHLLVSPSAVIGVAQGSATITSEVVYGVLSVAGPPLTNLWKHGVNQYFANEIAAKADINFQKDFHPREGKLIGLLIDVIASEHGYQTADWYRALKRKPGSVFNALARTQWAGQWVAAARTNRRVTAYCRQAGFEKINRDTFIKMLTDPARQISDQFTVFTHDFLTGAIPLGEAQGGE